MRGAAALRSESGVAFLGAVFVVLSLLAAPILLVYLFPGKVERIATGWLVVVVALIAWAVRSMARKGGGGRPGE